MLRIESGSIWRLMRLVCQRGSGALLRWRTRVSAPHEQISGGVVGRFGMVWFCGGVGLQLDAADAGCLLYELAGGGRTVSGHYGPGCQREAQGICLIVEVENDLA